MGDDAEDEAVERFLSHGMRELPSALGMLVYGDEDGLGKEDEPGLGLYEAHGLGW